MFFSVGSSLEDAILKALPCLLSNLHGTTNNARVDFYDKFQRAADDYDRDFIKKYDEDLDTTLIFVSVFPDNQIAGLISYPPEIGWSILRRHIRFYYRRSKQPRAGFPRNEPCSPQDPR